MAKKMLLLSVVLICAGAVRSQEFREGSRAGLDVQNGCTDAADVKAIRQIAVQWKDRYNSGDAAGVASLYAENADYLTQHYITGIIHGRATIQAYVQRGVDAHYHIDSIQILSMGCSSNIAYTVGRYESTTAGQKAMGVNLVVVRKMNGRWYIVAHEAAVPDPATAVRHLDISPLP
jgi:uncharacterized protein (TIGR02246 family)